MNNFELEKYLEITKNRKIKLQIEDCVFILSEKSAASMMVALRGALHRLHLLTVKSDVCLDCNRKKGQLHKIDTCGLMKCYLKDIFGNVEE